MLAHNKHAGYVKEQEHGHARFTPPQPLPEPLQQWWCHERASWGHHSEDEQRPGSQHQDNHSSPLSDHVVSPSSMHSNPAYSGGRTGSSATEMASITIHPTIANMVSSPASLCSAPSSPPQLSPERALAPAPSSPPHLPSSASSCPRNVSEPLEMESNLQHHDRHPPPHYQNKHTLVTERRPLLPSPLPPPPPGPASISHATRYRDEIMMDMTLDHPTVAELPASPSSDSKMDHCEPEPQRQVF
ncbi:hypothetical protein BGZ70_000489, partial [Mortierella alpina]